MSKKYKTGICLSGGGARGIAHLGVLESLQNHGIEPEVISGASMGAIVGCLYAAGYQPRFILEEVKKEKLTKFISWSLPGDGFFDLEYMEELLSHHIPVNNFSALKKPLHVSVSNLNTGKNEVIHEGSLFEYIIASASIPIVFKPRIIKHQTYVDGGLLNNLPAFAIRDICDKVIGVNISHSGKVEKVSGMKEIAERCLRLAIQNNVSENLKACDILIQPERVADFYTFDFRKADEIFQAGFDATEAMIEEIIKNLEIS